MSFRSYTPQRKTEILVVTPGFAAGDGGVGYVAGELVAEISMRAPFRFTWAAGVSADTPNPEIPGQTILPMHVPKALDYVSGKRLPFWDAPSRATLKNAIGGAELVWIHDTFYPGALTAFKMAKAMRRPIFITQHDNPSFHGHYINPVRRRWERFADRFFTGRMLKRATQVSFTTDAAARFYHGRIPFKTPVKIIPNGVATDLFHPPSADDYQGMRTRFALRDDQPVLLFNGHFEASGGLEVIRHLAVLLPKWRFWIAGHGRLTPETWYLPNVQVFRDRSGPSLAELYQASDLLILPGYDADAPQALQQALACQLPVMCSPDVVADRPGAPRCLVVKIDSRSPERTAKFWAQKLKAGRDIWPPAPDPAENVPFDVCWDWPQIAGYYTEILQFLCRTTVTG